MVNRLYFCKKCAHEFETYQPMNEELLKRCPVCKKNSLAQDISGVTTSIKQYNTLGMIAQQNSKRLGKYGVEDRERALQKKEDDMIAARTKKLIDAGYDVPERKKADPIEQKVMNLVQSGDKKAINKYIMEG